MSNRDWWELKNHIPTVKEDAPIEAKVSYERYKEQLKSTAVQITKHHASARCFFYAI